MKNIGQSDELICAVDVTAAATPADHPWRWCADSETQPSKRSALNSLVDWHLSDEWTARLDTREDGSPQGQHKSRNHLHASRSAQSSACPSSFCPRLPSLTRVRYRSSPCDCCLDVLEDMKEIRCARRWTGNEAASDEVLAFPQSQSPEGGTLWCQGVEAGWVSQRALSR